MDVLGIDVGITNEAADSDGNLYNFGVKYKVCGKDQSVVLYSIATAIITKAKSTNRAIALERFFNPIKKQSSPSWKGINKHKKVTLYIIKLGKTQHVPIIMVDPKGTSQWCSSCGNMENNYRSGEKFVCNKCKKELHADINAAKNVRLRALNKLPV